MFLLRLIRNQNLYLKEQDRLIIIYLMSWWKKINLQSNIKNYFFFREIQKVVKDLDTSILERKKGLIQEVETEALSRSICLASMSMELQRLISEIDIKMNFMRNQFHNTDHSTYISMTNVFIEHMKKDVLHQVDMITNTELERIKDPIINERENDRKKAKAIKFLDV
jgi:hypothetical protein